MLASANNEIKRRENIKIAAGEIEAVLKKYKLSMQDIDLQAFNKKKKRKTNNKGSSQRTTTDKRNRVQAKYTNPDNHEKWSGRGRAPAWVTKICQKEGLDLEAFKKDSRFKFT